MNSLNDMQQGRALQDVFKVQCFGCGSLNDHGLQIKSHWVGDQLICRWRPEPHHIGHPGVVYGGIIASVIDCHSIWTALSWHCRQIGHELASGPPPFGFVTARLAVNYLKPVAIDEDMELRARIAEPGDRRITVDCRLLQHDVECANAEVVTARIRLP